MSGRQGEVPSGVSHTPFTGLLVDPETYSYNNIFRKEKSVNHPKIRIMYIIICLKLEMVFHLLMIVRPRCELKHILIINDLGKTFAFSGK